MTGVTRRSVVRSSGVLLGGLPGGCLSGRTESSSLQLWVVNHTDDQHTVDAVLRDEDETVMVDATYSISARHPEEPPTVTKLDGLGPVPLASVLHLSASLDGGVTRYYDYEMSCDPNAEIQNRIIVRIQDRELDIGGNEC